MIIMSDDKHASLYFQQVNVLNLKTRITDILSYLLVIIGIIGNLLGLFIFSSSCRAWRRSSIYVCLAICSSITNVLCVIRYGSILHSRSRDVVLDLIGKTWWGCKIYEFSFSFRVISSWITLFWMFERLICVSPRLKIFFNRWNSLKLKFIIPILIMIIILGCVIGPSVYMFQPQLLNKAIRHLTKNNIDIYCGLDPNVSDKWQKYFYEVHFGPNHRTIRCLFSELIPAGGIILFDSSIVYHLIRTYQRLLHVNDIQTLKRQSRRTSWMNIVLILQSLLFLSSLFSHIIGHMMIVETFETWWVSLTVLINCSFNFYIYCLSGKAFRNEIYQSIRKILYILKRQQQQHRCCHYQKYQNAIYEVRYHKNNYRFILIRKTSHWNRLAN